MHSVYFYTLPGQNEGRIQFFLLLSAGINVKNLTFFRRATTIMTKPLNFIKMSEMYKNKLKVDLETAKILSKMTRGYAYAFQELGVLYFKNKYKKPDDAEAELKAELYAYAYEKIWDLTAVFGETSNLCRTLLMYFLPSVLSFFQKSKSY